MPSNDDERDNGINPRGTGEPVPEDSESIGSDPERIAHANLVNDPPTDTTVMLPCLHWGTVSHKSGDRLYRCHCGEEAIIRAVQRTVTKFVVAEKQPQLPSLMEQLESD
jgi:hypothetical protein